MNAFDVLGRDLHTALERRMAARRRLRRVARAGAVTLVLATFSTTVAVASTGISFDDLDPTRWTILSRGEVDGQASYINARDNQSGDESTFLEARDDGLSRYEAFTLHQRALAAAGNLPNEPGANCTADELTRAETVALDTLAGIGAPGLPKDSATMQVDGATRAAFAGGPCKGLHYAGERARWVYAGEEPASMLMPGARNTAAQVLR